MKRDIVRQIGVNKGAPRVFLEFSDLALAGFTPGRTYKRDVSLDDRRITLTVVDQGSHVVSRKERDGKQCPVIDINSSEALKPFEGMQAVRIVLTDNRIFILPLASETRRLERLRRLAAHLDASEVTTAASSFGGGVLDHAAHAGLEAAGIHAKLAMANEIDESLLEHAREHNAIVTETTQLVAAPMQELVQDEWAMSQIAKADFFQIGIPCSGASVAGRSSRGLKLPEHHPEVGHLVASALMLINRINPAVVVVECVTQYKSTASAQILRQQLRDSGYDVQEIDLKAQEFGCLENRDRWFLVASTRGLPVDLADLAPALRPVRTVSEVLDPIPADSPDWRNFDYLKRKEIRDAEKGSSFSMQVVTPASTSVGVLRKGYAKGGSTDPLLAHPTNPDLLRPFTVAEHARIKQVPVELVEGLGKTDGHILLGQGVVYQPVVELFKRIGQCLTAWRQGLRQDVQFKVDYNLGRATG
ncbi:MAG: DNA cytosine methyltransferase [Burkholderiaceae bacterium]|nr:DNA cytosine methyltransferase [Burkholderiaceae bacterium]